MVTKTDVLTTHYIIRPNEFLQSKVAQCPSELGELVTQTALWTKSEGQRTIWKAEDRLAQVKLLFLASLKKDYLDNPDLLRLVGHLPLSVRTFDEFWSIEQVADEEVVDHILQELEPSLVEQLEETGRPLVDAWISDFRERITSKAP